MTANIVSLTTTSIIRYKKVNKKPQCYRCEIKLKKHEKVVSHPRPGRLPRHYCLNCGMVVNLVSEKEVQHATTYDFHGTCMTCP